ncbi:MAG: hypothetical protein K9H26_09135 [Prolixibacteraceae bacterium]|nr:hypothetical protein [Prolixibacteraceae bacterium]
MKESELLYGLLFSFTKEEFSFADIAWLTAPFNVSETSVRTILSRMAGNKMIRVRKSGQKAYYSLTKKSGKISSNVALGFKKPDWSGWDNDWWGISVSLPVESQKERYQINKKIAKHRFALLHPGLWIRPYHENEKIETRLADLFRHQSVKTLRFRFHEEGDLLKVPLIWNIQEINDELKTCSRNLEKHGKHFNLDNPKEALIGKMVVGNLVVPVLFKDPLLPNRFLPKNWHGDKLRQQFREWDKMVTKKSKPYWEKIYQQEVNIFKK